MEGFNVILMKGLRVHTHNEWTINTDEDLLVMERMSWRIEHSFCKYIVIIFNLILGIPLWIETELK